MFLKDVCAPELLFRQQEELARFQEAEAERKRKLHERSLMEAERRKQQDREKIEAQVWNLPCLSDDPP